MKDGEEMTWGSAGNQRAKGPCGPQVTGEEERVAGRAQFEKMACLTQP